MRASGQRRAGEADGHGAVDAEPSGFIAAGGDDAAVAAAADDEWLAFEAAVFEAFDGNEEGVEVEVGDMSLSVEQHVRRFLGFVGFRWSWL